RMRPEIRPRPDRRGSARATAGRVPRPRALSAGAFTLAQILPPEASAAIARATGRVSLRREPRPVRRSERGAGDLQPLGIDHLRAVEPQVVEPERERRDG